MQDYELRLIDIGANLSHSAFREDLDQVVTNAKEAGVAHIIVTGTDLKSVEDAIELTNCYPGYLSLTAGFHPHVACDLDDAAFNAIARYASNDNVVAVGETGLDFNRNYSPRQQQEEAFARQLELACEINKPVFLHQRDSHETFISILSEYRPGLSSGVVHCFTDNKKALYDYLDLDMFIGVTGWICDERRGKELQELVKQIPEDRLLLETDAPYLLPRTIRPAPKSRRNEPGNMKEVLKMVSFCTNRSEELIAEETSRNAQSLFGIQLTA